MKKIFSTTSMEEIKEVIVTRHALILVTTHGVYLEPIIDINGRIYGHLRDKETK